MIQSGVFLGRLLGPLLKTGLPLMKNVIKPLAKSILFPLGSTAAAAAADAGIYKKILGSGCRHSSSSALLHHPSHNNNTISITSNDEMKDIIKIVKSLEDSGLLLKGVTETVQNEVKEQKGNLLTGKGAIATSQGRGIYRAGKGKGIVRDGYGNNSSKMDF